MWKNDLSLASFNKLVVAGGHKKYWFIVNWKIVWDENLKAVEVALRAESKIDRWLSYVRGKTWGKETTTWIVDLDECEIYYYNNKDWRESKTKVNVLNLAYEALLRTLGKL